MMLPDNCVGIMNYCFIKYDEDEELDPGDYLVLIEFKYDHEEKYHYEMNILCRGVSELYDETFLMNDTFEGQEHFKILAYCPLDVDLGILRSFAEDVKKRLEADNEQ